MSEVTAVSHQRRQKVDAARQVWRAKLVDLSRRNNLLFFRELQTGTLDLSAAPTERMHSLLQSGGDSSQGVPLQRLVARAQYDGAAARLRHIAARAQMNLEERGLETLFLGLGMASWQPPDGGRPTAAPALLMPLAATATGRESRAWTLKRNGDVRLNEVLLLALKTGYGVELDSDTLLTEVLGDDPEEDFDLEPVFDRIIVAARDRDVPEFGVLPQFVISNFHFQKLAIVQDLDEYGEQLAAHDLIAGIAGDLEARARARGNRDFGDPRELDRVPPDHEFLIRDADSTQQQSIACALSGANGVISGPPGTGKSQTIANLVAEYAARGKSVLFVAEKRAALDVVRRRLVDADLGHLCLDLHGADISRKLVAAQLRESLDLIRTVTVPDATALHRRLVKRRDELNAHVRRMHNPRQPSGLSIYQLFGRLARMPEEARSEVRWNGSELATLDVPIQDRARAVLSELGEGFAELVLGNDPSPWTGAAFESAEDVERAMAGAKRLAPVWRELTEALREAEAANKLRPAASLADIHERLRVFAAVESMLSRYAPSVFHLDTEKLLSELAPGRTLLGRVWAFCTSAQFRAARSELLRARRAGKVALPQLLSDLDELSRVSTDWQGVAHDHTGPRPIMHADRLRLALDAVQKDLPSLLSLFPGKAPLPISELDEWLPRLAADGITPFRILRAGELERELSALDQGFTLAEIRRTRKPARIWPDVFTSAWLQSCLDEVWRHEPIIPSFNGRVQDAAVAEFRQLDRQRLEAAIARVRRTHAERVISVRNEHPEQDALVCREAEKKTRHMPLRRLFREASDVLLALRPCWMASPLSVSQLIPGNRQYFDVVIFDEASQVLPEDAVTSLLRGRQAVVAGDRRQLPPTTFFAATDDSGEDDEAQGISGFESILDVMSSFLDPPWSLDWHYRSRDERLIAYPNHHIYNGRLVTFPGAGGEPAITHHLVASGTGPMDEESGSAEVQKVVELVLEHARVRPDESLGVIAMGIKHALRVEAAVERARLELPELDEFFSPNHPERFFVKNLERVQGDERDAIILTIGYGKDASGRLPYRFGPLLYEGGERRLNVAITRSRVRMNVVSGFSHLDMEPGRSRAKGVELLRGFLEYAASHGARIQGSTVTNVPLNDFEQSVYEALVHRGLKIIPQVGTSRYRIDLVAQHRERPGQHVLAIECDGATYHSSPTARDRDRLRQQHLEALGWTFHRIWSMDWFLRREDEIERTLEAYERALSRLDEPVPPADAATEAPENASAGTPFLAVDPRPKRPRVPAGRGDIDAYARSELEAMVTWVCSKGLLTENQIVREVATALGFRRVGSRIDGAIRSAARRVAQRAEEFGEPS